MVLGPRLAAAQPAYAEQTLYSFCSQSNCADGTYPNGPLIMDGSGNLYGTTSSSGNCAGFNCGVAFELLPKPGGGWTRKILYTFCSLKNCADGDFPGPLVMDKAGNLYGTTTWGGNPGSVCETSIPICSGVVFKLTPDGSGGWTESVLYTFCSQNNCGDGAGGGGLVMDAAGNLFGTTSGGGNNSTGCGVISSVAGCGVLFELTPNGNGWTYSTLHKFCSLSNCPDGANPGDLIIDSARNLYGTTQLGGTAGNGCSSTPFGCGVVFEATSNQTGGWNETVLHSFCSQSKCADGSGPNGLVIDPFGNLYGTTAGGGANNNTNVCISACGTVFELAPNQSRTAWTETVLYNFCSKNNCSDGASPSGSLITDGAGNLYGVTYSGGANSNTNLCWNGNSSDAPCGAIFELTPNFNRTAWTERVLYSFCSQSNCVDGAFPISGLVMDGVGNLYGASTAGGNTSGVCPGGVNIGPSGCGVVFELAAPLSGLFSAVLPAGRSATVNNPVTAFATIINSGSGAATGCGIAPIGNPPLNFVYQTTNPATNAITGSPNTPVAIGGNASQSFVIALTPTATINPVNISFSFACAGAVQAAVETGINSLELSASSSPVPDIVALAASGDPGYVDIPGAKGTGVFAVATVNLGSAAPITVSANTGAANLPVTVTLCQTNPSSGVCLAAPAASVTATIAANATPTFGIFVAGSAAVSNSPGVNRIFVAFADPGGVLRGETSVAVRTQ